MKTSFKVLAMSLMAVIGSTAHASNTHLFRCETPHNLSGFENTDIYVAERVQKDSRVSSQKNQALLGVMLYDGELGAQTRSARFDGGGELGAAELTIDGNGEVTVTYKSRVDTRVATIKFPKTLLDDGATGLIRIQADLQSLSNPADSVHFDQTMKCKASSLAVDLLKFLKR